MNICLKNTNIQRFFITFTYARDSARRVHHPVLFIIANMMTLTKPNKKSVQLKVVGTISIFIR